MKIKYGMLILVLVSLLVLSGCKAAEQTADKSVTENATDGYPNPDVGLPLVTTSDGYPAPDSAAGEPQPGYPAPAGAPVRENAARVQVEILALTPSEKSPEYVVAHVRVNSLGMVEGFDPYDPEMVGKEIDILLTTADAASLVVGDLIDLTVSYRGDEWGGGYYGTGITSLK